MPDIGSEIKSIPSWEEEGEKTNDGTDDTANQQAHGAEVQVPPAEVYVRWVWVFRTHDKW